MRRPLSRFFPCHSQFFFLGLLPQPSWLVGVCPPFTATLSWASRPQATLPEQEWGSLGVSCEFSSLIWDIKLSLVIEDKKKNHRLQGQGVREESGKNVRGRQSTKGQRAEGWAVQGMRSRCSGFWGLPRPLAVPTSFLERAVYGGACMGRSRSKRQDPEVLGPQAP